MTHQRNLAAIFDVDGTLIADDALERIFITHLWRKGELKGRDALRWVGGIFDAFSSGRHPLKGNKAYLRGKDPEKMRHLAQECFEQDIAGRLLPGMLSRLRWHQISGHEVLLLSGSLDFLLEPLARHLGVSRRIAARLETDDGLLTGKIAGPHPYGTAKAECLKDLNRDGWLDLKRSFAYADHYSDRHLLSMVGNPVATNPDHRLRQLALDKGWLIEDFAETDQSDFGREFKFL